MIQRSQKCIATSVASAPLGEAKRAVAADGNRLNPHTRGGSPVFSPRFLTGAAAFGSSMPFAPTPSGQTSPPHCSGNGRLTTPLPQARLRDRAMPPSTKTPLPGLGWVPRQLLLLTGLAITGGGAALVAGAGSRQMNGCCKPAQPARSSPPPPGDISGETGSVVGRSSAGDHRRLRASVIIGLVREA
jgi:hypothetical protein